MKTLKIGSAHKRRAKGKVSPLLATGIEFDSLLEGTKQANNLLIG
jgi:hypothetical protein